MKWPSGQSANPGGQTHGERLFRAMEALVMTGLDIAQPMELEDGVPLTVADVARLLAVGRSRVHQLDDVLQPTRCACGVRRYDPAAVVAYVNSRRAAGRARAAAQAEWMRELRRRMGEP